MATMYQRYSFALCAVALCAPGLSACGGSASLTPDSIPRTHGATFGNVEIFHGEESVTSGAVVTFMDAGGRTKAEVRADSEGWVFATVERGLTRLKIGNTDTNVMFDIPGGSQITYFGHIRVDTAPADSRRSVMAGAIPGAVLGGVIGAGIGAAIGAGSAETKRNVAIANLFDAAKAEYENRYGDQARLLLPYNSLASSESQLSLAERRSAATPPGAVAFFFGIRKRQAKAICDEAGRTWSHHGGVARCSGTASAGLVGASAQLDFIEDRLSAVELIISPPEDGQVWANELRDTQAELTRIYGKPKERSFEVPEECKGAEQFLPCVIEGEVTGAASWSLDDGRSVLLTIAGAPSPPTIRVRVTAAPPKGTAPPDAPPSP